MYDISLLTEKVTKLLLTALTNSPVFGGAAPTFSVGVSGQHPQLGSSGADCDLNLYLFHLTEDKSTKNSFWTQANVSGQPTGQPVAFQPLCLDLLFLLSARSSVGWEQEQQVMSVATRALHENATFTLTEPAPNGQPTSKVTFTMESPTWDELSRLWQALTVPLRMTAVYRAGVVMLMPQKGAVAQPPGKTFRYFAEPHEPVRAGDTKLFATTRHVRYRAPGGAPREFDQLPASVAPAPAGVAGQEFTLRGVGLTASDHLYLVTYNSDGSTSEMDITGWIQPFVPPYASPLPADGVPLLGRPPATPPGACPPPGRYGVRIGRTTPPGWRSDTAVLCVAPWIDPAGGPLLTASGGVYTLTAVNVPAAGAELRLDTVHLARVPGAPVAGEWSLSDTTLTFRAPAELAPGTYAIKLRAAGVEADPALWAVVP